MSQVNAEIDGPGYLTIYAFDRSEIYGEFADGALVADSDGLLTLSGTAGGSTADTFARLGAEGIDHVAYDFVTPAATRSGVGILMPPTRADSPGVAVISVQVDE